MILTEVPCLGIPTLRLVEWDYFNLNFRNHWDTGHQILCDQQVPYDTVLSIKLVVDSSE